MVQQCAFIDNTSIFCTPCLRTVQVNVYLTELNKGTRMTMHEPRVNRSPICGVPTPTRSRLWTLRRPANEVLNSSEDAHTKSMSTFENNEHLQAGGSSREGVAALGRSIQLLLVFVSTVEPNHDPPQGAHCGPHRHASYHKPQHAEEKIANAGRRDVFFIRVPEIAHVESDQYQAER